METVSQELLVQLRERIEREMEGLQIQDFNVTPDRDHDGDRILKVEIVYNEAAGTPETGRMSALTRHIRPWLETQMPGAFPVFRFVTAGELSDATQ